MIFLVTEHHFGALVLLEDSEDEKKMKLDFSL